MLCFVVNEEWKKNILHTQSCNCHWMTQKEGKYLFLEHAAEHIIWITAFPSLKQTENAV